MISNIVQEFKNIIWPNKQKVIEDFGITLVFAIFLMVIVVFMDNGTQILFESIANRFF